MIQRKIKCVSRSLQISFHSPLLLSKFCFSPSGPYTQDFVQEDQFFTPYPSLFLHTCISLLLVPRQITICLVASNNTDLLYHSYVIQKSGHSQYQLGFCSKFHQAKSKCEPDCIIFWTLGKNLLLSLFR